MLLSTS